MRRSYVGASGALFAASPMAIAVASWVHGPDVRALPPWVMITATLTFLCMAVGSAYLPRNLHTGRILVSASLVGLLALLFPELQTSPSLALGVLLGVAGIASALWSTTRHRPRPAWVRRSLLSLRGRGAALSATGMWLVTALGGHQHDSLVALAAVAMSVLVASIIALHWVIRHGKEHGWRAGFLALAVAGAAVGITLPQGTPWSALGAFTLIPAVAVIVLPGLEHEGIEHVDWWEPILNHPERLLIATFLALCAAGTLLLALPASGARGEGVGLMNAAFTAVSAVCVTGLVVLDTPVDFTPFGHVVILVLIQLGGLGIMTFSTAAIRLLGRRMSLRHEGAVAGLLSPQDRSQLFGATRRLIAVTAAAEALGTALLVAPLMAHGHGFFAALWEALFTSISAFCNAGFGLQRNNLVAYQESPLILHVVGGLIIAGGLSPAVIVAFPTLVRRAPRPRPVSAQVKLAVVTTIALLVIGFLGILAFEWNNTLAGLSFQDRLHNAWFQSVTLRTAGFNSIDLGLVRPATLSLMMLWMFIGGSPGGTAGGIKTTTLAVMIMAVASAVRGQWIVHAFGRRIPHKTVYKAAAIVTVGGTAAFLALTALQLTQDMSTRLAAFEVVSALGTVGLSIGGTAALDGVGKIIIIGCMFMGRVGPLTLFMFLSQRMRTVLWERPEEDIDVG